MITEKGYPEMSDISIYQGLAASQEPRPNGPFQRIYSTRLEINPFCWTVWMAATTPPSLKINVLYRTDCVYHARGAAPCKVGHLCR